ncbi:hypothetical protein CLU79DRAFT_724095 [Phycomyces nitens]|nr:hypothetical protein CLU79DRAFT_724095 [Phycomyces nitens]
MDPDSTNCFEAGPQELETITLTQFAAYFEFSKKRPSRNSTATDINQGDINDDIYYDPPEDQADNMQENNDENTHYGEPGQVYCLLQNQGFIRKRTKPCVIQYYRFNIDQDAEEYFRCLLMLYKSWRNKEEEELLSINYEKKFLENSETIMLAKQKEFSQVDDDVLDRYFEMLSLEHSNMDTEREDKSVENADTLAPPIAENDFRRYTLDIDDNEEGEYHRITDLTEELNVNGSTKNNRLSYLEKVSIPKWLSNSEYQDLLSMLNL